MIPKLTITGVEETLADIDARIAALKDGIRADAERWGKGATDEMVRTHTFQNRTYRLESSIGYHLVAFDGTYTLGVFASAPYASQVEHGHPGPPPARPYPFFWPVFWEHEPLLYDALQVTLDTSLQGAESLRRVG